jgi:hypothetical protein
MTLAQKRSMIGGETAFFVYRGPSARYFIAGDFLSYRLQQGSEMVAL